MPETTTTQSASEQKKTIMFVDDDKFLLDMYALKFSRNGFDVRCAMGPEEALKILRDNFIPDILLLDVVMPGMDGIQLLGVIRNENLAKGSAIVMLTNQGLAEDIERAKKLNVDGYIIKAMTIPSEVFEEVQKIYAGVKKAA
ncbi:MAG: two component transcriptional regulator, two-component system, OmpR family, response regulator [Candidatus Taylorbacteria bacterium]|nr:two component transcriptional regulator, two-component system, OmpR family, response regulator [Candidatus Taylorbacteria bacterium]